MRNKLITVSFFTCFAFVQTCFSQIPTENRFLDGNLFQIHTKAYHFINIDGIKKIRYIFSVNNKSTSKIYKLNIGEKSLTNSSPAIATNNLDDWKTKFNAPKSWTAQSGRYEDPVTSFIWQINDNLDSDLAARDAVAQPAKTLWDSYIVEVPRRYSTIYTTYGALDTELQKSYSSTILKYDTTVPVGTINNLLTKHTIKKGFFDINISISAKDNYDPLPEIALDSIQDITTSSTGAMVSPFGAGYALNVANDATKGIYPTIITLAADAKVAKKYRIKYKITDASDNQTTVSTVVTIPKQ